MPVYLCYAVCGCEHSSVLGAMPCYVKGERTPVILHKPDGGLRNAGDAAPLARWSLFEPAVTPIDLHLQEN